MAQDKQEPKNPYNDLDNPNYGHYPYSVWKTCANAYNAYWKPQVAALQQRVKELEAINRNCENLRWGNIEDSNAIISNLEKKIAALESQLKNMVELDENQKLPGWEYYIWPSPRSDKLQSDYQTGKIEKDVKNRKQHIIQEEESKIYEKSQQDMLKAGFRKVKALASQKGETK